jgi:tRNA pseudouridine synthase 10
MTTKFDFKKVRKRLLEMGICDRCLGRQFSLLFKGHLIGEIGWAVRNSESEKETEEGLNRVGKITLKKDCLLCQGIFLRTPEMAGKALELLQNYDYDSFLVGATVPEELLIKEEKLWSEIGAAYCESLKKDIVREMGMIVESKTKRLVDFKHPDIMVLADFIQDKVKLQVNPLFIYGKYRKLVRGIPQTKWYCRECYGKGCKHCNFRGKMYETSVEELIAKKVLEITGGADEKFHGAGREDIDAKMLEGRPFVLQVNEPVVRNVDFGNLEKEINRYAKGKVEVSGLRKSTKEELRYLKAVKLDKTYVATVKCGKKITEKRLKEMEGFFRNRQISQRTPQRVEHRRADLVRKKLVKEVEMEKIGDKKFSAVVKCEAGLYVKELVSGDGERTKPSFSEFLKTKCGCEKLDVKEVHEIGGGT